MSAAGTELRRYRALLARVDTWYRRVKRTHPDKVVCERGCRDCCIGLFEISPADAELLREGMLRAKPAVRRDIEIRAARLLARLRRIRPGLGATLAGMTPRQVGELCDAVGDVECPVLGPENECRLYSHRPIVCRLAGPPVVSRSGRTISAETCAHCTLRPCETPSIDYEGIRRAERRILNRMRPEDPAVTLLIPQALAHRGGTLSLRTRPQKSVTLQSRSTP